MNTAAGWRRPPRGRRDAGRFAELGATAAAVPTAHGALYDPSGLDVTPHATGSAS